MAHRNFVAPKRISLNDGIDVPPRRKTSSVNRTGTNHRTEKSTSHNTSSSTVNTTLFKNRNIWNSVALQQEMVSKYKIKTKNVSDVLVGEDGTPVKKIQVKLSLAQKLGIVEQPELPLSRSEWQEVEHTAHQRKHHSDPCSICMETFGVEQQIILNCSHVFHRTCFTSFEKFVGTLRKCPICRKGGYQKKLSGEGKKLYMEQCATEFVAPFSPITEQSLNSNPHRSLTFISISIQRIVRGFLARKRYYRLWLDHHPEEKSKYLARKLSIISDKLDTFTNIETRKIDNYMASLEETIKISRLTFMEAGEWDKIRDEAIDRLQYSGVCAICQCALHNASENTSHSSTPSYRRCVVTSCGHCFHEQCIASFEQFHENMHSTAPIDNESQHHHSKFPTCPVCRSPYIRQMLYETYDL